VGLAERDKRQTMGASSSRNRKTGESKISMKNKKIIIICLVWFLLKKKIIKPVFFKKKLKFVQTDQFCFGYFRIKIGLFSLTWFF
jgi:hypothetical protein